MPKTIRDRMKGSVATAWLDFGRAQDQLAEVYNTFNEQHPELAEGFAIATALAEQAKTVLEACYAQAWGGLPGDWESTRDRK